MKKKYVAVFSDMATLKQKKEQSGWTASSECFNTELMYILTGFSAAMLTKYPFDS